MNEISKLASSLRKYAAQGLGTTEETAETKNLHLTKAQFMERMLKEKDGWALLDCLEGGEHRVVERLGLMHGYHNMDDDLEIYFDIPEWNNLVAHLRIVNSV